MLKKHYELRYNPDVEGKRVAAVLHIGEDRLPNDLFVIPDAAVEFGSIEEADMYLAASGFEKGEARRGETRPAFPLRRRRVQERPDVGGDAVFLIRWKRRKTDVWETYASGDDFIASRPRCACGSKQEMLLHMAAEGFRIGDVVDDTTELKARTLEPSH